MEQELFWLLVKVNQDDKIKIKENVTNKVIPSILVPQNKSKTSSTSTRNFLIKFLTAFLSALHPAWF